MHRLMSALFVLAVCAGRVDATHAAMTVEVLETFPPGQEVTLGENQVFYLRLAYNTDAPRRIWARPYFEGREVDAYSNPSPRYAQGSGEALAWFSFTKAGLQVDEIRVSAGNSHPRVVANHRLRMVVVDNAAVTTAEPAWIARLRSQAGSVGPDPQALAIAADSAGDSILGGFMLAMLLVGMLGLIAPAWALWRWRGGWRVAAAIPAALMAFVILRIVIGVAFNPTSHNLWPFEILLSGGLASILMLGLWLARRLAGTGQPR